MWQKTDCIQSAMSKIYANIREIGRLKKGKHTGRSQKTSKHQDRKVKATCLENRKCATKQIKNKWAEAGVNVVTEL